MKVAFNVQPVDGPWGGGNRFVKLLAATIEARGGRVVFSLADPDIDIVVIVDPRRRNPALTFMPHEVLTRPRTVVVHRINECDERKGTRSMNLRLRLANHFADHTLFIASWLRDLDVWNRAGESSVVLNGADPALFHPDTANLWDGRQPLKLVTHHWGAHRNKGLDIYGHLDRLQESQRWQGKLSFTYVGNLPADAGLRNARLLPPLDGEALARELRGHHAYVTASINEPAGMHHIEGALSGLPLLYRESGALPEYCKGFGRGFSGPDDLEAGLEALIAGYDGYKASLASYPYTSQRMCDGYIALFEDLLTRRAAILAGRRIPGLAIRLLSRWLIV